MVHPCKRVRKRATRDERRRKAEHGGTGTSHSRTAPGTIRAISVDKAGLFSWRLHARRFVGSVTQRRGGPLAHRPPAQWRRPRMWICVGPRDRPEASPSSTSGGRMGGFLDEKKMNGGRQSNGALRPLLVVWLVHFLGDLFFLVTQPQQTRTSLRHAGIFWGIFCRVEPNTTRTHRQTPQIAITRSFQHAGKPPFRSLPPRNCGL